MDPESQDTLTRFNYVFTIIFIIEMGMKILGLGFRTYIRDRMNFFDAGISILGLIEMVFISGSGSTLSAFRAIRILRIFRVVRVVRLFRYLQSMSHIMNKISNNIANLFYLLLFLMLFILIFSIIGIHIFAGKLNFEETKNKYNFDDFHFSFLSIFQIMTEEN